MNSSKHFLHQTSHSISNRTRLGVSIKLGCRYRHVCMIKLLLWRCKKKEKNIKCVTLRLIDIVILFLKNSLFTFVNFFWRRLFMIFFKKSFFRLTSFHNFVNKLKYNGILYHIFGYIYTYIHIFWRCCWVDRGYVECGICIINIEGNLTASVKNYFLYNTVITQ